MGLQINFYMSKKIENEFVSFLNEKDFLFLLYNIKSQNIEPYPHIQTLYNNEHYLYKHEYGDIVNKYDNNCTIDMLCSPVIEFTRTRIDEKDRIIRRGRLWISNSDSKDSNTDTHIIKKDYNMLVRWIKKNVPLQNVPKGEFLVREYTNDDILELTKQGYKLTGM